MQLTPSARVILGMLEIGPKSGYEIKQLADRTTRHFWRIGYGQIYPELRQLEAAGLIETDEHPTGGRARKLHSITPAGRGALHGWLTGPGEMGFELRDEATLRFFFADTLSANETAELLRATRAHHQRLLAELHEIEGLARDSGTPGRPNFRLLTLRKGIALHQSLVAWCDEMAREIPGDGQG